MNAFLNIGDFPEWDKMTPAAADEALPKLLADAEKRIDDLEAKCEVTWQAFRETSDAADPLWKAWGALSHLLSVCNNDEWRKVQQKHQQAIVMFSLRCGQSKKFYERALELAKTETEGVRRRILEKAILGARHAGVALPPEKQERFNAIQAELAKLSTDFHNAVIDATKSFTLRLATAEEMAGVPENLREQLRDTSEDGGYKVTIDDAVYPVFMKHARNRAARETLYRARSTRAPENAPRIDQILKLRTELAQLLGYQNYAERSISSKCAPSVQAVWKMIDELAAASREPAKRETAELEDFVKATDPTFPLPLKPWDVAYWCERLREKKYAYSEEELKQYFNLPDVLSGLFGLTHRLFDVTIEEVVKNPPPVWHKDVRFFCVKNKEGEAIAHFYFDPYIRPETKSGGAWMNEFVSRRCDANGVWHLPLATICCNQAKPDSTGRSLMRFIEVETLFHEFGHALQHMLTTVNEPDAAGLNLIEWDAVEVASQFMENWCTHAPTLKRFAKNAVTAQPIPEELVAKVRAGKNYRAAHACLRQLSFAKIDLTLHEAKEKDVAPNTIKERIFNDYTPGSFIPEDRFLNAFGHIFAGGYAAGYYGYKWSEVISADVFAAFEEAGLDDEERIVAVGKRYRDTFLALGGSVNPMEVFARFRGRAPSVDAILRQQGLK